MWSDYGESEEKVKAMMKDMRKNGIQAYINGSVWANLVTDTIEFFAYRIIKTEEPAFIGIRNAEKTYWRHERQGLLLFFTRNLDNEEIRRYAKEWALTVESIKDLTNFVGWKEVMMNDVN